MISTRSAITSHAALALVVILLASSARAAYFLPVGDLPGGDFQSLAFDLSSDGGTVVGWSEAGPLRAFRWTAGSGIVDLGVLPGDSLSGGFAVNADGSVVVGMSGVANIQAYRWTGPGGMIGIGDLPGGASNSQANDVSAIYPVETDPVSPSMSAPTAASSSAGPVWLRALRLSTGRKAQAWSAWAISRAVTSRALRVASMRMAA